MVPGLRGPAGGPCKSGDITGWGLSGLDDRKANSTRLLDIARKALAPVPLSIFRSNSKFDENSKHSSVIYTWPFTTIFCTRHDSVTVVTCAKYRCDRSSIFETIAFWIFIEFRIRSNMLRGTGARQALICTRCPSPPATPSLYPQSVPSLLTPSRSTVNTRLCLLLHIHNTTWYFIIFHTCLSTDSWCVKSAWYHKRFFNQGLSFLWNWCLRIYFV